MCVCRRMRSHVSNKKELIMSFQSTGGSLVECGKSLRKIGQAERTLIEKTVSRFTAPLESFLETDIKTITVSLLFQGLKL